MRARPTGTASGVKVLLDENLQHRLSELTSHEAFAVRY